MTPAAHSGEAEAEAYPRRWAALSVLLLAAFMNLIDVTIVNVALPTLTRSLGATSSDLQWVVAGYLLAFALGLLPFGRLGDVVGRRRMFMAGIIGFTLFSAVCGAAPTIGWLVAARIAQGLSAAMMMPQVLAIAQVIFPPHERALAFSFFGLNAGLGAVTGPLLGGFLIDADLFGLDWRPIFLINLPIGIAAAIAARRLVPPIPGHPDVRIDWIGVPIAALFVLSLIFPLIEGREAGWPAWVFATMGAGVPLGFAFVLWQRRQARDGGPQLLPLELMTDRSYLLGTAMTVTLFSAMPSFFMVFAIFLQSGFGFTPFESGYTTAPMPLGLLLASLVSGRLGSRMLRGRAALGTALVFAGMLWMRWLVLGFHDAIDHWVVAPPLILCGLGMGLAISSMFQIALASIPARDAGSGSGALQSFQQLGMAFGVAIGGEVFFSSLGHAASPGHAAYVGALGNTFFYLYSAYAAVLLLLAVSGRHDGFGQRPRPETVGA